MYSHSKNERAGIAYGKENLLKDRLEVQKKKKLEEVSDSKVKIKIFTRT